MKQIVFIIGCVLVVLVGCETKAPVSSTMVDCCVAHKDSLEIIMNIPVKVKPEYVSAYKAAFDKCQAETLKEEACLAYELFQSYNDSTEFHLFERWTNKPGHLYHMETEHLKIYLEEVEDMRITPRTSRITTVVCPKLNE